MSSKGQTTLDVTIKPEYYPINEGTKGNYFKLKYSKGDKCIKRKDLIYNNNYKQECSDECSSHSSSYNRDSCSSYNRDSCNSSNRDSCNSIDRDSCNSSNGSNSIDRDSGSNSSNIPKSHKLKKTIPLATFVQLTDIHIIDASNPSRATFLGVFIPEDPILSDSFRSYEAFSTQVAECMVRKINSVKRGPHLKQKISTAICTGDNGDSQCKNELQNYINILDGKKVVPNPATPGKYVGMQDNYESVSYKYYYHPDKNPEGLEPDNYKVDLGYPNYQGILNAAAKTFCATGLKIPWFTCNGNHDTCKLGNYDLGFYQMLNLFNQFATGNVPDLGSKMVDFITPVQALLFARALKLQDTQGLIDILNKAVLREIPPSEKRLQYTSADFINAHFNSSLIPGNIGHGFTERNIKDNVMYYTFKVSDKITGIMLDTCNPNGNLEDPILAPNGSIGSIQVSWLENELRKRHSSYYNNQGQLVKTNNKDELIILFGHHTIETLNNNATTPTTFDNDPQRIMGPEFVKLIHRYFNILFFCSGHEHRNFIKSYPDPNGKSQGFWEITTASHIDFPQESRIIEIGENNDGTISIFSTIIDHESPANVNRECFPKDCCSQSSYECDTSTSKCDTSKYDTSDYTSKSKYDTSTSKYDTSKSKCDTSTSKCDTSEYEEEYTIEEIASISRELSYNDPFIVNQFNDAEYRTGTPLDRNVELLLFNPLKRCK